VKVDSLQLAELLSAKFSHDLSGLLGSLTGVLELAGDAAPGSADDEVALATETASVLLLRLKLLREAWGGVDEPMDLATLAARKRGTVGEHRLELDLRGFAAGTVFPAPMARMVLNVLLLAGDSLPRGGMLALSGDAANRVVAEITGPGAAWPAGFCRGIADATQAWAALDGPRDLQGPLTVLIAGAIGMQLSLMTGSPPALVLTPAAAPAV
jgi:histidine phosphotransferase ChpT